MKNLKEKGNKRISIELVTVRCPECEANLQIEDGRSSKFCTYCGMKLMIENNCEKIIRRSMRQDSKKLKRLRWSR